jgi:hypothetical protein
VCWLNALCVLSDPPLLHLVTPPGKKLHATACAGVDRLIAATKPAAATATTIAFIDNVVVVFIVLYRLKRYIKTSITLLYKKTSV